MDSSAIGILFLGKILIILLIIGIIRRNKRIKDKKALQEIEAMQIREYGRKINDVVRNKRLN